MVFNWDKYSLEYRREQKKKVIDFYGGKCLCCGISNIDFLSIDHINGGGNKHRKEIGVSAGNTFYRWLIRNNFPDGFRTLCYNCNSYKEYVVRRAA
jgi:hypothetical protein